MLSVEVIDTPEKFERVAVAWNAIYAEDTHAQVFLSWDWLRNWFDITPYRWLVLAVTRAVEDAYVAFLPLAITTAGRLGLHERQLYLGGKPISDYCGFVAAPDAAEAALKSLSAFVFRELAWDRFHVAHVIDDRLGLFLSALDDAQFSVNWDSPVKCPYAELPADFDTYVDSLSPKTRFNLRRSMRIIEALPDFRATEGADDGYERDLDVVLELWRRRWGALSPADAGRYRTQLTRAADGGRLWLRMLWSGTTPIAGLVSLRDPVKRDWHYYFGGYNADFARYSPGKAVIGWSIRDAIVQGYKRFDFLLGAEEYKSSFCGTHVRLARSATVLRMNIASRLRRRLLRCLGSPMSRTS